MYLKFQYRNLIWISAAETKKSKKLILDIFQKLSKDSDFLLLNHINIFRVKEIDKPNDTLSQISKLFFP